MIMGTTVPIDIDIVKKTLRYFTMYFSEFRESFSEEDQEELERLMLYWVRKSPVPKYLKDQNTGKKYLEVFGNGTRDD